MDASFQATYRKGRNCCPDHKKKDELVSLIRHEATTRQTYQNNEKPICGTHAAASESHFGETLAQSASEHPASTFLCWARPALRRLTDRSL